MTSARTPRLALAVALMATAFWGVGCGSDEPERPKPVPTNPELEAYSKPGTPAPDKADSIADACAAMLQHEAEGCDSDIAEDAADECLDTWRTNDARGCGAAYARFIECRTDTLDCEKGWDESCDLYFDAAFICTTDFVQRTSCTPINVSGICGGSAYVYGCVTQRKPFPECESWPETERPTYCCF